MEVTFFFRINILILYDLTVPPVINSLRYEELIIRAGESIQIPCLAAGYPNPRIAWRFEESPVSNQNLRYRMHPDGSLEIPYANVWDQGRYMCIAKNVAGNDTRVVDVRVMGKVLSWPSGLAYRTQVLVLAAECGFESRP